MALLLDVVEAGSLSAAARSRGIPLATLSRKISDLEAHLRAKLLLRTSRTLTLTDAGRTYIEACRRILADVEESERAAAGEYSAPRGELVITAPVLFGRLHVLPAVTEFLRRYRDIDIRMVLSDQVVHLLEDHVDVALRIGRLPDSGMVAIGLGSTRRVTCASPHYLAAGGWPSRPSDLSGHRCVSLDSSQRGWMFSADGTELTVPITPRLVVNSSDAAIDAAVAGLGIIRVLGYQVAERLATGQLQLLLEEFEPTPRPVSLVYAARGLLPIKLRAFLDFAAPWLRARLDLVRIR